MYIDKSTIYFNNKKNILWEKAHVACLTQESG